MGTSLKNWYLIGWNAASFVGWTYIECLCCLHVFSLITKGSNLSTYSLYAKTIIPLAIMQSSQWIELVHTLLKLTRSNLMVQICQLSGRFNALMLSLLFAWFNNTNAISEQSYSNDYLNVGYVTLLLVWSLAEVIRYPFYICKLLNTHSSLLEWLRYNAFLILYPIGFAAEMRCWYGLREFLGANGNIGNPSLNYQYSMPSQLNVQISLNGWALITFCLTPFVGAYMFYGMLASRKKYMRSQTGHGRKETKKD